jgi:hypothetical protein
MSSELFLTIGRMVLRPIISLLRMVLELAFDVLGRLLVLGIFVFSGWVLFFLWFVRHVRSLPGGLFMLRPGVVPCLTGCRPVSCGPVGDRNVDPVRRRLRNETLGHRGPKGDPLYRMRRLLIKASARLDNRGEKRIQGLLRVGAPYGEVGDGWVGQGKRPGYLSDRRPAVGQGVANLAIAGLPARDQKWWQHTYPMIIGNKDATSTALELAPNAIGCWPSAVVLAV